jgi:hypothetical protein
MSTMFKCKLSLDENFFTVKYSAKENKDLDWEDKNKPFFQKRWEPTLSFVTDDIRKILEGVKIPDVWMIIDEFE